MLLLDAGGERKDEEFDISQIIATVRDLRFEVTKLREKTNTQEDPDFTENPLDFLDLKELEEAAKEEEEDGDKDK